MVTFLEQETNSQTTQWKRKHESTPIRPKVFASASNFFTSVVPERTGILPWLLGNFLSQYNSFQYRFPRIFVKIRKKKLI